MRKHLPLLLLIWLTAQLLCSAQYAQRWEYKLWEAPNGYNDERIERSLNHLGAQGWELVSAHRKSNRADNILYTFKRPATGDYRPPRPQPQPEPERPIHSERTLNIYLDDKGKASLPRYLHGDFNDTLKAILKRNPNQPIVIYAHPKAKPTEIASLYKRLQSYGANSLKVEVDK